MKVVHVLLHGRPLCQFTDLLPGDWPQGHVWVSMADFGLAGRYVCEECAEERGWIDAIKEVGRLESGGKSEMN